MSFEALPAVLAVTVALLNTTTAVITHVDQRRKARAEQKQDDDFSASDFVQRLPQETLKIANRMASDLRDLRTDLKSYGFETDKTVQQIQEEFGFWDRVWRRNVSLDTVVTHLQSVNAPLSRLLDNLIAVAQCYGLEELIVQSYKDAGRQREAMGDITSRTRPIGEIIDEIERFLNQVIGQVEDARVGGVP